jgi:hypothetical protein
MRVLDYYYIARLRAKWRICYCPGGKLLKYVYKASLHIYIGYILMCGFYSNIYAKK